MPEEARRHAPAAARNSDPILAVLRDELPSSGLVLEVASGTGEHAIHFAKALPRLTWQPSDPDPGARASIAAWRETAGLANLLAPIALDAAASQWPVDRAEALLCINMVHISGWAATVGLFKGCAKVLAPRAPLILYGPYIEDGIDTVASNMEFDRSLKKRNPEWGLRNIADMDKVAAEFGFERATRVEMPANNLMLIYRKG